MRRKGLVDAADKELFMMRACQPHVLHADRRDLSTPPLRCLAQLRTRVLDTMKRAIAAAEVASGARGAALLSALDAADSRTAAHTAAGTAHTQDGSAMDVDADVVSAVVLRALRGVVDHEPSAFLKASAGGLMQQLT